MFNPGYEDGDRTFSLSLREDEAFTYLFHELLQLLHQYLAVLQRALQFHVALSFRQKLLQAQRVCRRSSQMDASAVVKYRNDAQRTLLRCGLRQQLIGQEADLVLQLWHLVMACE